MELTTTQRDMIAKKLARLLIGVLRTGKENPEIMARGYVIDAAKSLDAQLDISKEYGVIRVIYNRGTVLFIRDDSTI